MITFSLKDINLNLEITRPECIISYSNSRPLFRHVSMQWNESKMKYGLNIGQSRNKSIDKNARKYFYKINIKNLANFLGKSDRKY